MANNKKLSIKEADEQVRSAERQLAEAKLRKKRKCYHSQVSDAHLIPIAEAKLPDRIKQKYSDTTYVCDGCDDIFETAPYTPQEIEKLFFDLHSILAQIQLLDGPKLGDQEKAELEAAFDKVDYLEATADFYLEMVKLLSKGNNNGGKKKTSKGGIGITSGMMR